MSWTEERGTSDEGRRRLKAPRKRAEDGASKRPGGGRVVERREQMLRAALDVIVERGYADTRIADVAERTGTVGELRNELNGAPAAAHTELRDWLSASS